MQVKQVDYTHTEQEFDAMRQLMLESYLVSRKPLNWRLAMAENWNYASRYLEPLEYFTSRAHLWRSGAGELAGFLIRDNALIYPQVQYRYRHIEPEMIEWAEFNWPGEKREINLMVYDWDRERQGLLTQRGYENRGAIEDVRIYDLTRMYPEPVLPRGFRVASMAEIENPRARIDLENSIWGAALDEAWFRGKCSAPSYSPAWDLVAVSPEGRLAASCLVWVYPRLHAAEIDPLGTHPAYRRQGLGRALVLESFRRMRASGIRYAYIASFARDPIVCQLYASLEPVETIQGFHWRKTV